MNVVTLDKEMRARLNGLDQRLALLDEAGNAVGFFLPMQDYQELLLSSLKIPLSDEEIERRRQDKTGCSLDEIWKRLRVK